MNEPSVRASVSSSGAARAAVPIVALDVPDFAAAKSIVRTLGEHADFYKVGLELFAAEGPSVVQWLRGEGKHVFVDLKLHDIPNTVRGAARSVARLGASLLTVHASGGADMVRAAVDGAAEGAIEFASGDVSRSSANHASDHACRIIAVTLLTSLDAPTIAQCWGRESLSVEDEVVRLASLARAGSASGVVCSGHELSSLRAAYGDSLGYLVPGLRLEGGAAHDQQRVMTPAAAVAGGATWLILGRAVTAAADPVAAMIEVRQSL